MSTFVPNIPLLRKVLEHVEAEDAKAQRGEASDWNQDEWICGTVACFAGRAVLMSGAVVKPGCFLGSSHVRMPDSDQDEHVSEAAQRILGITEKNGVDLFDWVNTAADLRRICEDIAGERL